MRIVLLLLGLVAVAGAAPKKHQPGALVLLVDRSGSMQGPKLDTAKEAALAALETLAPTDQIAIITFDSDAKVEIPLQPAANKKQIAKDVAKIVAGGGTSFLPALQAVSEMLRDRKLAWKHVVMLSDGESPSDGVVAMVKLLRKANVTISTVGVAGADRNLLSAISDEGGGRLYMVEDLGALPKIFMKEIEDAVR